MMWRTYIFRIFKWLAAIAFALFIGVLAVFYVFKEDIEAYAIKAVNDQLKVSFTVKDFDVTWWKSFPNFTFQLNDVIVSESEKVFNKPLCEAAEISLVFNIWDIIHGRFLISKIKSYDLFLRIGFNAASKGNFDIIKSKNDSTSSSASFDLRKILLTKTIFLYKDVASKNLSSLSLSNTSLSLNKKNEILDLIIDTKGAINFSIFKKDTFIANQKLKIKSSLSISENINVHSLAIFIADSKLNISGDIFKINTKPTLSLKVQSENLELHQLFSFIPNRNFDKSNYETKGTLDADGIISGTLDNLKANINFNITNGSLQEKSYNIGLEKIEFVANLNYGDKEFLNIKKFNAVLDEELITGSGRIENFSNPFVDIKFEGNLSLQKISNLAKMEQAMEGKANVDIHYKGLIASLQNTTNYTEWQGEGKVILIDAGISNKKGERILSNLNGAFLIKDNDLEISNLKGLLAGKLFIFQGKVQKIASYLFSEHKEIGIFGKLNAQYLDYDKVAYIMAQESSNTSAPVSLKLPANLDLNLNINIDTFKQQNFICSQLSCNAQLAHSFLSLQQLRMLFYEGNLSGSLTVKQDNATLDFVPVGYFIANNVPIVKLFTAFDNFSQSEITSNNLSGYIDAKISVAGIWDQYLNCKMPSLFANVDYTIRNGLLKDYKPLEAMSKFIEIEELRKITFDEFIHNFEIKDNMMYFSPIEINNSALNLSLISGKHSLENFMDYHFKINLNQVLAKKFSLRRNRDLSLYEETSNGGLNIFVHILGYPDKLAITYDKKNTISTIKQQAAEEKKTIQNILRQEFGLKSKDTIVPKPKHISIDWDE